MVIYLTRYMFSERERERERERFKMTSRTWTKFKPLSHFYCFLSYTVKEKRDMHDVFILLSTFIWLYCNARYTGDCIMILRDFKQILNYFPIELKILYCQSKKNYWFFFSPLSQIIMILYSEFWNGEALVKCKDLMTCKKIKQYVNKWSDYYYYFNYIIVTNVNLKIFSIVFWLHYP